MILKNSKTLTNLVNAYAGETQALVRYKMLEYAARQQGFLAIADLICKVKTNEYNHARMLYSFIQTSDKGTINNLEVCSGYPFKEKWDFVENFALAVEDETNELTKIYPEFAKVAKEEGFLDIAGLFNNLIQVETCHKMLFTQIHEGLKNKTLYKKTVAVKWKCGDCGYETTAKEAPMVCPLCQAKQGVFLIPIDDSSNG